MVGQSYLWCRLKCSKEFNRPDGAEKVIKIRKAIDFMIFEIESGLTAKLQSITIA